MMKIERGEGNSTKWRKYYQTPMYPWIFRLCMHTIVVITIYKRHKVFWDYLPWHSEIGFLDRCMRFVLLSRMFIYIRRIWRKQMQRVRSKDKFMLLSTQCTLKFTNHKNYQIPTTQTTHLNSQDLFSQRTYKAQIQAHQDFSTMRDQIKTSNNSDDDTYPHFAPNKHGCFISAWYSLIVNREWNLSIGCILNLTVTVC